MAEEIQDPPLSQLRNEPEIELHIEKPKKSLKKVLRWLNSYGMKLDSIDTQISLKEELDECFNNDELCERMYNAIMRSFNEGMECVLVRQKFQELSAKDKSNIVLSQILTSAKRTFKTSQQNSHQTINQLIDEIIVNNPNLTNYQKNLLAETRVFGCTMTNGIKNMRTISEFDPYSHFMAFIERVKGSFDNDVSMKLIRSTHRLILEALQEKALQSLTNGSLREYNKLSNLARKLEFEMVSHPLLTSMKLKILKKYKADRIILGSGTVEEKSKQMYRYLLNCVKSNKCCYFSTKKELKKWYKDCVRQHGFN